jgi:hypothetical protein
MLFLKSDLELFPACLLTIVKRHAIYICVCFITYFLLIAFHVLFRLKMEAHEIRLFCYVLPSGLGSTSGQTCRNPRSTPCPHKSQKVRVDLLLSKK